MSEPTDNPTEADERPWEEPGSCRMDCAPHRGNLLMLLLTTSFTCGVLALCLGATAVIGLPLGLVTMGMARRDLAAMAAGRMDPGGYGQVEQVEFEAGLTAILNLLALLFAPASQILLDVVLETVRRL